MHILSLFFIGFLSLISIVSSLSLDDVQAGSDKQLASNFVPGRYIIEFESGSYGNIVKRAEDGTIDSILSDSGLKINVINEFQSSIFQGASISVSSLSSTNSLSDDDSSTLQDLQNTQGIKNAWQASYITLDDEINSADAAVWNPHIQTGVQALHEQGFSGEGVKIAILDTGVDYTHPALGGGIGPDFPIVGGYDFSEDVTNPTDDPMDCAGHGTFVSSIIIANSTELTGVAPDAKITMYKVFPCADSTTDDVIFAGLLKAYEDKPDIISLSLGSARGYNSMPISRLATQISETITILFAAGNDGETGPYFASSGASGEGVIAVASSHATQLVAWSANASSSSGETFDLAYVSNEGPAFDLDGTYEAIVTDSNACIYSGEAATSEKKLFIGKLGHCFVGSLLNTLDGKGFSVALVYPDSASTSLTYLGIELIDTNVLQNIGEASNEFGVWANAQAEAGHTVSVTFSSSPDSITALNNTNIDAGQVDFYSTWGPTFENNYYPTLTGPGGKVFGASVGGGFSVASGTSFSTPYLAGIAALYKAAHPDVSSQELRNRLIAASEELYLFESAVTSTGDDLSHLDTVYKAPSIQQGAGLINALKLFEEKTRILSDPYLELNDTANRVEDFTITIKNEDTKSVTYSIEHSGGVTVNVRSAGNHYVNIYYPPYDGTLVANVTLSSTKLTLAAGASGDITVNIKAPAGVDPDVGPVFSGKIWFNGDNGDSIAVPYLGVELDTKEWTPWEDTTLVVGYDEESGFIYNLTNTDRFPAAFDPSSLHAPQIYFAVRYGSEFISFDIVDEDYDISSYKYPLVAGENGYTGSIRTLPDIFGGYTNYPVEYYSRFTEVSFVSFQSYANGTIIPEGRYRILSRALKIFGDRSNNDDWQLYLSDPFEVGPAEQKSSTFSASSSVATTDTEPIVVPSFFPSSTISEEASSTITEEASSTSTLSTTSTSSVSTTSLPTNAIPTPTGVDVITNVTIVDEVTGSAESHPRDWFTFSITIDTVRPLVEGDVAQFYIPGFTDFPTYQQLQATGNLAGVLTVETNGLFSIEFSDLVSWNKINGTFTFSAHLNETVINSITKPESREFTVITPEQEFTNTLDFVALPEDKPFRVSYWDGARPVWIIDIPGTLGPWESVTIESSVNSFEYSYVCDEFTKVIGTEFDDLKNITKSKEAAEYSSSRCAVRGQKFVYSEEILESEVLRIGYTAELDGFTFNFENSVTVVVTTASGSETFTLSDKIHVYTQGDYNDLFAYRFPTDTTTEESASSSTVYESSSLDYYTSSESGYYSSDEYLASYNHSSSSYEYSSSSYDYSSSSYEYSKSSYDISSSAVASSSVQYSSGASYTSAESSSTDDVSATLTQSSSADLVSSSSSLPTESSTFEPTITGSFVNGQLSWRVNVPPQLGPWNDVYINTTSDSTFTFADVKYVIDGETRFINSSSLSFFEFDTQVYDDENGLDLSFVGRFLSGERFTVKLVVAVTTPDNGFRLAKRAVQTWELEDTIDISATGSSSVISSESSTISSTGTTSSDAIASTSSDSGFAGSSNVDATSTTVDATTDSTVSSSSATSSGVAGASTVGTSSTGASSASTASTAYPTDSNGAASSYQSYESTVADPTSLTNPIITSIVTEGEESTTLVTITSCDISGCSESTSLAWVTTVVTTISNVETSYTTYCPITTTTDSTTESNTNVKTYSTKSQVTETPKTSEDYTTNSEGKTVSKTTEGTKYGSTATDSTTPGKVIVESVTTVNGEGSTTTIASTTSDIGITNSFLTGVSKASSVSNNDSQVTVSTVTHKHTVTTSDSTSGVTDTPSGGAGGSGSSTTPITSVVSATTSPSESVSTQTSDSTSSIVTISTFDASNGGSLLNINNCLSLITILLSLSFL